MRRNGRSGARVAVALLAALLGIVLGTTSTAAREQPAAGARAAGGTICISLEWAMTPTRSEVGFVLANRGNTVWRGVFLPTAGSHGTVCEAGLPAGRYLVCEVAYGGYDIQLLPVPGQTAYESCIGLTLADGETETTAFRNVPLVPAAASQAIGTVRGHPLQVPGPLLHGELLR